MKDYHHILTLNIKLIGNAAMTDLFKCEKKKATCCSPKTAIKKRERELLERKRIERIEEKLPFNYSEAEEKKREREIHFKAI